MAKRDALRPQRVVTIFGSSRVRPGDPEYEAALRLGRLLAERGWVLCNGGHDGTMEAAARGAKEAGGKTIGVSFSLYRPESPNAWLDQEIVAESLFTRLERLATMGEAYIVLHGGIGTLLELCLVWNLVQSPEFAYKPVIVVGESWATIVDVLRAHLSMYPWEASSLTVVEDVDQAVDRLAAHFSSAEAKPGVSGR